MADIDWRSHSNRVLDLLPFLRTLQRSISLFQGLRIRPRCRSGRCPDLQYPTPSGLENYVDKLNGALLRPTIPDPRPTD